MADLHSCIRQIFQDRFIVGQDWSGVPISHDILRGEYWIYNEKVEDSLKINGFTVKFFKLKQLPEEPEVRLLEWRTVDLLNFFNLATTPEENALSDLVKALKESKLNPSTLSEMSRKYGTPQTKTLIAPALQRAGIKKQLQILYKQGGGNLLFFYDQNLSQISDTFSLYKAEKVCFTNQARILGQGLEGTTLFQGEVTMFGCPSLVNLLYIQYPGGQYTFRDEYSFCAWSGNVSALTRATAYLQ